MAAQYDVVTVGGGIGGASVARTMAAAGARVLVVEHETKFRDRVRGESLMWGVADADAMGIGDVLRRGCGNEAPFWDVTMVPMPFGPRDVSVTTPGGKAYITFYHPDMQEDVLAAAATAGAEVRRGAWVRDVRGGSRPELTVECGGHTEEIGARLVVGADGRSSVTRKWAGFPVQRDPDGLRLAGVLLANVAPPRQDTQYMWLNPALGQEALLIPIGGGRARAYLGYHKDADGTRYQGARDLPRFLQACGETGMPREFCSDATAAGPLATFDGADTWVDHPYARGVALIGDAAAASDPSYGQGLSLTMRDARVLTDNLLGTDDWGAAANAYAADHDRYYANTHNVERWFTELFLARGPEADAKRARALPLIAEDPTRMPDHINSGPDELADGAMRARLFGEA
jgi:2-polyprenyl-6-methoxyphenol hydroxylase-like FAD-dependent oxidoreductase